MGTGATAAVVAQCCWCSSTFENKQFKILHVLQLCSDEEASKRLPRFAAL
jgi:hypothetical protein